MAAISPHLTATLPFLPTLWPRPRRLPPNAFVASVSPHRTAGVALHGSRHCNPLERRLHGFENTISFWTQTEHNKQALFASGRDDRPVRLAYQPPASGTFLSKQTSHQPPASSTFLSEQISTSQPATSQTNRLDSSSSPDGPPVLTILAGAIVFLLVLWVIGSTVTWIVGLVFGAAKS